MLVSAVRICALDAGDTLAIVPAENELLYHLGDALDAEISIDDGDLRFILIGSSENVF